MATRIDIGIDGGGSGCRVAISVDGGEITETRGGAANVVTDPAAAEAAIREALLTALKTHGLRLEHMTRARVCAGLAGARLPGVADAFATRLPFLAYVVDDSVTALEGALEGAEGTLASLGTGSFFIRKSREGTRHVGGWGFQLGDEGSAAWLGRRALSLSLRVADGRLPPDPLAEALTRAAPPHPVLFRPRRQPGRFRATGAPRPGTCRDAPRAPPDRRGDRGALRWPARRGPRTGRAPRPRRRPGRASAQPPARRPSV